MPLEQQVKLLRVLETGEYRPVGSNKTELAQVRVVAATLPTGVAQTYDLDGTGTANVAAFSLSAGQNRTDVDFDYRGTASVNDRV